MKWIILSALILIISSLGSALYFMMKDRGGSARMVRSLALRIGLSIALFAGIWVAHSLGYIQATGIKIGQ
jgi:hypothetical protein